MWLEYFANTVKKANTVLEIIGANGGEENRK